MIDHAALKVAFQRFTIAGTSENPDGHGPPFTAPWFLIDASTSEPEVNWPGEMLGTFDRFSAADDARWRAIAKELSNASEQAPCERCNGEGWLYPIDPMHADGSYVTARPCPSCNHGGYQP